MDHWRRGHKQMCKKIHRGGNAELYHADKKYKEAVAVAVEACAADTRSACSVPHTQPQRELSDPWDWREQRSTGPGIWKMRAGRPSAPRRSCDSPWGLVSSAMFVVAGGA